MSAANPIWWFRVVEAAALIRWTWSDGAPPVTQLCSVRLPTSHARSRHIPVRAVSVTTRTTLRLESGLEHDLVRMLDRDEQTAWLVSQPCRIDAGSGRRGDLKHTPDLLSMTPSGHVTLWDARHPHRMDERFRRAAEFTKVACADVGWDYRIFTGLPEVQRLNLIWLGGARRSRPWHTVWTPQILDHVADPSTDATVAGVMSLDDGSGEAISTMWHLLWAGALTADLSVPLRLDTQLGLRPTLEAM